MPDFSHLAQLQVKPEKTVPFPIHQITVNGKTPVLMLAPATDANKPYFNALLKRSAKTARQVKAGRVNSGMIEENRDEDRVLYPKHIVKGWQDMIDAKGEEVKFSKSDCEDFLTQLPDWIFDEIRTHAGEPQNFADVLDVKVKAKN